MADDPRKQFRALMYGTKFSLAELRTVLASQLFKDFAATYPKQSEWSKRAIQTNEWSRRPKAPPHS